MSEGRALPSSGKGAPGRPPLTRGAEEAPLGQYGSRNTWASPTSGTHCPADRATGPWGQTVHPWVNAQEVWQPVARPSEAHQG